MALLALLGQALGPVVPVQAAAQAVDLSASPFGDVPICHAGTPGGPGGEAPSGHAPHGPQCALCPACHALAAAAAAALPVPASPIAAPPLAPPARRAPPCARPPIPPDHHPAWPDRTLSAAARCRSPPCQDLP